MKPLLLAFCARLLAQTNFGAHFLDDNLVEFKEVKLTPEEIEKILHPKEDEKK